MGVPSVFDRTGVSHLRALEAEAIHIFREVAAEFANPVLLYSIGKDSSVLLRLAQKAFHPARIPFPLLHVDTTYKFREMIEFRDRMAREIGFKLIVSTNRKAIEDGCSPFRFGTSKCCGLLKTQALLDGIREGRFDAAIGGARRDEEKSRAKERIFSFRDAQGQWDPKNQRPELWNLFNGRIGQGESIRVFPAFELDRAGRLALHLSRRDPGGAAVLRQGTSDGGARQLAHFRRTGNCAAAARREAANGAVPDAVAGVLALHRGYPLGRRHATQDHCGAAQLPALGAGESRHRLRSGRLDGVEETGGLLLTC